MGENTEELVVSLENSLSSDICDTVGDLAEVGLDAVMDDGILKDIPILSTVVGLYRIGHTIRERHEIKQLALFVAELNRGCTDESKRKQLLEKLNSDTRKSKQEIEYILVVLDNYLEYVCVSCFGPFSGLQIRQNRAVKSGEEWVKRYMPVLLRCQIASAPSLMSFSSPRRMRRKRMMLLLPG